MTDWLLLLLFAAAWLAGWCSRWQWDRRHWEVDEDESFDRWARDLP